MSRLIVFAPLHVTCSLTDKARRPTSTARAVLKAYHRLGLPEQNSMTFPHVRAVKLSGETFALDGNLQGAATSLEKDGCLLLKGATDLRPIEPAMEARYSQKGLEKTSEDDGSLDIGSTLDSVTRDVFLNRVIGAILFSADNEYIITSYNPFIYFNKIRFGMGRDPKADLYASIPGLVVVTCVHLGGDISVSWHFSVQEGSRDGRSDGKPVILRANGGDIFVCVGWLVRSPPHLENRENAYSIDVTYCGKSAPEGKIFPPLKERILQLENEREECVSTEDRQNVLWSGNNFVA